MAYTVGSASVDIVPDFKNAQLAITKFFNSKPDQFKIPVTLDIDERGLKRTEQQAAAAGTRVSKAMNDAATRSQAEADRLADQIVEARFKALGRAHAEALRMNTQREREAAREAKRLLDEETKARIEAQRAVEQASKDQARLFAQAHAEALRLNAEYDRAARARMRLEEENLRASMRTAEALADARRKADEQELRDAQRADEQRFKNEERAFRESLRVQKSHLEAFLRATAEQEKIRIQVELDEREAMLSGRRTGGLIARSIHAEIRQNAGLIAAVVGGALIAGGPASLAAASGLFMGIGAVAAAQSERIRSTWRGLWDEIKSGAVSDANVLVPAYDRLAGAIGQSFQRMRPLIRDAFEASEGQIDSFGASLTHATENALPGLVRAVQNGGPVIQGLGDALESIGTGLTGFFDRISAHAPGAGAAFSALGDSLAALLPLLGELLGQGAELGAIVLPVLTGAFQGALAVADALGGSLPVLVSGFLAFRVAQGAGRFITGWSQSLLRASEAGGLFATSQARAAGALQTAARAAPIVGIAVAGVGLVMAQASQQGQEWAQALLEGGEAAQKARAQMSDYGTAFDEANSGVGGFVAGLIGFTAQSYLTNSAIEQGNSRFDEMLAKMTPLERASHDLSVAERELEEVSLDSASTAGDLATAKGKVEAAARRQAQAEEELERATRGVTEAMGEQADAARARVDSEFAYQKSLLDVENALADVNTAQGDLDTARKEGTAEDVAAAELKLREALLAVNQSYADQLSAVNQRATSNLPAALDEEQKKLIGYKAELDELNRMISQGVVLPPALEQYRQQLIGITGQADGAMLAQAQLATALGEVGVAVESIPNSKAIKIDAPTQEVVQRLVDLGFTVTTLPDGSVRVEALTEEAVANLGNLSADLATLHGTTATPHAVLKDDGFIGPIKRDQALAGTLNSTFIGPVATLYDSNFIGPVHRDIQLANQLGGMRPSPTASLIDNASRGILAIQGYLNGLQNKTVTLTLNQVTNQIVRRSTITQDQYTGGAAEGGAIEDIRLRRVPHYKHASGGAVIGRGSAFDDLIPAYGPNPSAKYSIANGEHILDGRDVALMGGQAGVYAFREMLNSGQLRSPGPDTAIRAMVETQKVGREPSSPTPTEKLRTVNLYTPDIPTALRELRAVEHQEAVLASPWQRR